MASFREEAAAAAEALSRLNRESDRAAKGTQRREQDAERSALTKAIGGATIAAIGGLGGAASAFGATGSSAAAADVAFGSALGALRKTTFGGIPVGDLLSRVSGLDTAIRASEGASQRTFEQFDDLARYNVPIADEVLQRNIDINLQQQSRVESLRDRVNSKFGLGAIVEAADAAKGEDSVLSQILRVLEGIRDLIPGAGAQR